MNRQWNITKGFLPSEYDGCAIICYCNKVGRPTHGNLQRTIEALVKMGHRAGEINGEGDGCGVLTDIPRLLWREALEEAGHPGELAESASFALAHLLVPPEALTTDSSVKEELLQRFSDHGLEILMQRPGPVRSEALSANARRSEPFFWQIALRCPDQKRAPVLLASLAAAIERETPVHVASLSGHVAAYKVHGAPEILPHYYPELRRRDFLSSLTIGHSRYSTNTLPTVLRAQPFGLLAHNGEINTIERLRDEARMMGIDLPQGGSDSQDLNRLLEGLMFRHGFSLFAAMEMVFPPIFSEMDRMPEERRNMYRLFRRLLSASAQGPAAVIARCADRCVFSVDALGLRPLWFGETEEEIFASSELGVVPHSEILSDPRPLSPGEKVGIRMFPGKPLQIYDHGELIADVLTSIATRTDLAAHGRELYRGEELPAAPEEISSPFRRTAGLRQENLLAANAWKASDLATLRQSAVKRQEPITSLGYDGPLASLSSQRQNIADFFKEQVAVVTNPAIDREREMEHFSTRVILGPRPVLRRNSHDNVVLEIPFLTCGRREAKTTTDREVSREAGTCSLEDLLGFFSSGRGRYRILSCALRSGETVTDSLDRLRKEALSAVSRGCLLLLRATARRSRPSSSSLRRVSPISAEPQKFGVPNISTT